MVACHKLNRSCLLWSHDAKNDSISACEETEILSSYCFLIEALKAQSEKSRNYMIPRTNEFELKSSHFSVIQ